MLIFDLSHELLVHFLTQSLLYTHSYKRPTSFRKKGPCHYSKVPYIEFNYYIVLITISITHSLVQQAALTTLLTIRAYYSENNGVDKYLSPVSGRRTTIVLPSFSGRFAI